MPRGRTISAFLITPFAIPLVFFGLTLSPQGLGWENLGYTAIYAISALPIAYLSELLLAFPAWLLFRRYGIHAWSAFAAGGAVLAVACYVVAVETLQNGNFRVHLPEFNPLDSGLLWIDVLAGTACGLLFRAIVFPRLSAKNPA